MLGSIGMPELMIIFIVALIIFGPRKLPELGRSLGKSLSEFKRASNELRSTLEDEIRLEEQREARAATRAQDAAAKPGPTPVDAAAATSASATAPNAQAGESSPTSHEHDEHTTPRSASGA
jgi:TatA/E family protein of Tat protein translocase